VERSTDYCGYVFTKESIFTHKAGSLKTAIGGQASSLLLIGLKKYLQKW
jgi:hypothetical protein